jgi:hypothetical protein
MKKIIALVVAVVLLAAGYWYWAPAKGAKETQIYENATYGYTVSYPARFETLEGSNDDVVVFDSGASDIFIAVDQSNEYCYLALCQKPALSDQLINSITWEDLGNESYDDNDGTEEGPSPARHAYRTTHNGLRYYVLFNKVADERAVLESFKFQ